MKPKREREKERERAHARAREREGEREREREIAQNSNMVAGLLCVHVCVWEKESDGTK